MIYASVDPVIDRWVRQHGLVLLTEFAGEACRFWYTSRGTECFQISVEPPQAAAVTVNAWSVETDDDAEFEATWPVPVAELEAALVAATEQIEAWNRRNRPAAFVR